jgi:hypothetical protein
MVRTKMKYEQENVSMEHRCPGQQMDGWTNSKMADERGSHNFFNNDNFIH